MNQKTISKKQRLFSLTTLKNKIKCFSISSWLFFVVGILFFPFQGFSFEKKQFEEDTMSFLEEKKQHFFQRTYVTLKQELANSIKESKAVSNIKINSLLGTQNMIGSMNSSSCTCTNFLYVNDPTLDLTHKFTLNNDGSIGSEIGSTWVDMEVINNPHGVVADLNGNLYISQINQSGDPAVNRLFKVDCDGNVLDNNFIPNWLFSYNLTTIGNTLYAVGQNPSTFGFEVVAYDLCTKALINSLALPGSIASWGLTLGKDGNLYITSSWAGFGGNHHIYRVQSDLSAYVSVATISNSNANNYALGVAQDEHLNLFLVTFHAQTGASTIYKINPGGSVIHSITDSNLNQVGFGGAWGISYNEDAGKLYVGTLADDCVAVIDAGGVSGNLAYIAGEGIAHVPSTYSKAINILKECCPTNNNLVIDSTLCVSAVNDALFLQDLINCEGTICEGVWQEGGSNTGLKYNSCNNSITINSLNACGTFTLDSDGTGNNPQCGAFTITVNIEVAEITAPVIAGGETICAGLNPAAFTATTPAAGSGAITYQWQSSTTSCSTGFTNIGGATGATYDPPTNIMETTYYRVIAYAAGGCSTGNCQDISNCLTVTVDQGCAPCDVTIVANDLSSCVAGQFDATISIDWAQAPTTGNIEYSINGGSFQAISPARSNFSAAATGEIIIIPDLSCNSTKKITLRFADESDCTEEMVFVFPPGDPTGHIYCQETGKIITGGTISVTPPSGGSVSIGMDGSSGHYYWLATGSPVTAGTYTMTYNPPAGYSTTGTPGDRTGDTDDAIDPTFGSEDNPTNQDPLLLGSDTTNGGGSLIDFSANANPFFLDFNLEQNDPFVDLNNIPLGCCGNATPGADVTPDCTTGIAGIAYKDSNFDGINNDSDGGIGGIEVSAYDCDGNLIGTTTTDSDGEYQIPGTTTGQEYRIEFNLSGELTCFATPTFNGDDNNSTVQFQQAGTCVELGLYDRNECLNPLFNIGSDSHYDGKLFADGMGFVTCGTLVQSDPNSRYTFGVFDIRSLTFGNDRPINNLGDYHHPSWRVDSIGNVFGLTLDNHKNVFATASAHYGAGYGFVTTTSPAVIRYGEIGGGEDDLGAAGTIYKIDAYTGQATVFAQLPQQAASFTHINCEGSETKARNTGPALGNIDYDSLHNQFFVTNFEDGKIYRIGADGTTLSTFDPFAADNGAAGIASDKKPYGITVNPDFTKVFFGILNFDLNPELYSVDLDANGDFTGSPTLHTSLMGNGDIGGPFLPPSASWVAISDLEFTPDGYLVAGIRAGCFNVIGSSHNHGGTYYIMESAQGDGIFNDVHDNPRIHYPSDPYGPDDGYGGIGIWEKEDGTYDYLLSSADIRQEDGPHGLLIFPQNYTTTGNNTSEFILRPAATVSYLSSYDGTSGPGEDFKGIGGDVIALSACDPLPLEIGNYVWIDTDGDGIQDACEEGLDNIVIRLYDENCTLIGLDTTDANGYYNFNFSNVDSTGLNPDGTPITHFNSLDTNTLYYIVLGEEGDWDGTKNKFTANSEVYNLTLTDEGSKDNIDSDASEGTGCGFTEAPFIAVTTGDFGSIDHNSDFGLTPTLSLGNLVWEDLNNNGIVDANESGIENVELIVFSVGADGVKDGGDDLALDTTLTNASGNYTFKSLDEGTYYVKVNSGIPNNMVSSTGTGADGSGTADYEPGAFTDENVNDNDDGTQMGNMIMSDTVQLSLKMEPINDGDTDNNTNLSVDFGLIRLLSVGNLVWEDANNDGLNNNSEVGIDGITIYLLDDGSDDIKGNGDDTILDSVITASGGQYLFDSLYPGEYYIKLNSGIPANMLSSTAKENNSLDTEPAADPDSDDLNDDDNGTQMGTMVMSELVSLTLSNEPTDDGDVDSTSNLAVDFGLFTPLSIGNLVWEDLNNNGLVDGGESGVENVELILFTVGPDGVKDGGDDIQIAIDTTDVNGNYLFDTLVAGTYYVKINSGIPNNMTSATGAGTDGTANSDYEPGAMTDGNTNNDDDGTQMGSMIMSDTLNLAKNAEPTNDDDADDNTNLSVDFGLIPMLSIGNLVWTDTNNDGFNNNGETGLNDIKVQLYSAGADDTKGTADDILLDSTLTADGGLYLFDSLAPGEYFVKLTDLNASMISSTGEGTSTITGAGSFEPAADPDDTDTNDDDSGTQMGIMVMSDLVLLSLSDEPINDGDTDSTSNLSVDFGLLQTMAVGNLVWEDDDNDGLVDGGEAGIQDIEVILFELGLDGLKGTLDDVEIKKDTTDTNGQYLFEYVTEGTYYVKLNDGIPTNMYSSTGTGADGSGASTYEPFTGTDLDVNDNDDGTQMIVGNTLMVRSDTFQLATNTEPTNDDDTDNNTNHSIDFGLIPLMSIGNLVWEDLDNNGLNNSESGVDGIEVILFDPVDGTKGNGDDIGLDTVITVGGGLFLFDSLYPGDYYIKLNSGMPPGMISSTGEGILSITGTGSAEPAADPDDTNTNNDDSGTQMDTMVMSDIVTLNLNNEPTDDGDADDNSNLAVDFGLFQTLAIGNLVWEDLDNNGQFDSGTESGIEEVELILYTLGPGGVKDGGDDVEFGRDTTDANGNYLFEPLAAGTYYVKINSGIPTGYVSANGAGTNGSNPANFEPGATTDNDTNNDDDGTQMGSMIMSDTIQLEKK